MEEEKKDLELEVLKDVISLFESASAYLRKLNNLDLETRKRVGDYLANRYSFRFYNEDIFGMIMSEPKKDK